MTDTVLARLAALKTTPTAELRKQWEALFETPPPLYNRRFLENRLAYRIQELHYGGLKPETLKTLATLAVRLDAKTSTGRARPDTDMPVEGTQLLREWGGVMHRVTVLRDGFDWEGRRYGSLSVIARTITGTQWNGPAFFGLRRKPRGGA
jgi:hypothetical protein